ncbi:hypothetical protein CASFOL_018606 [Castilleja foliolosa]|uniref:Uncharacterized protein n=1 Tax=Castilleja foliolosa TaxID=1961234 RepID=A0ABD3D568_9LAMI
MATFSTSCISISLPELIVFSPQNPTKKTQALSLSKSHNLEPRSCTKILGTRIRAIQREESVVHDEKDRELENKLNDSVNGNSNVDEVISKNKTIEEIGQEDAWFKGKEQDEVEAIWMLGQEDAWFKGKEQDEVEVSVAPGGRWNKFKTYSTIQRTLEIWGFVLSFVFKVWLNNQKFSYRGGMTEEKKKQRRKVLAKWLKENILRLGPTFIKIGQQFSTRADILAQEYVDQLSELQGEDLLAVAADQPFRFPATFTFVVRAFSVLDGIGKGLDPRFDITEISKPYALELLRFREAGVEVIVKISRTDGIGNLVQSTIYFRQADRVEKLADVIQRLEQGDLKLRVRALESERAFQRVATVQTTIGSVCLPI